MSNDKKQTGAVSITDGDVTPISRTPIDRISSEDWSSLSISELYTHLSILENRYYMIQEMNKPDIAKQIASAINQLRTLINEKQNNEGNIIT
jgi:hypothetical protein